jgi:hypothetical protein
MPADNSGEPQHEEPDRRDIAAILAAARANFNAAQVGYHDLVGPEPWRRLTGLRNAIVQSVGVSHALQNLRHLVPDFDAWWDAKVGEMRAEPMLSYVYPLRTQMLKRGAGRRTGGFRRWPRCAEHDVGGLERGDRLVPERDA